LVKSLVGIGETEQSKSQAERRFSVRHVCQAEGKSKITHSDELAIRKVVDELNRVGSTAGR
jgi:hypothetical protein